MTMPRLSLRVAAAEEVVVPEDIEVGVEGDLGDRIIGPGAATTDLMGVTTVLIIGHGVMDSLLDGGDMVRIGEEAITTICHIHRLMALTLVMGTDTLIR